MARRYSSLTPQYGFDDRTGRYFVASGPNKGGFVSFNDARSALDDYLDKQTAKVQSLGEQLRNREISIAKWQRETERTLAKIHVASGAMAKGGWANMTKADYGRIGVLVKQEMGGVKGVHKGLRGLAKDIQNGLPLDGRFTNRLRQYAEAGRHTYHVIQTREMGERGFDEERSVRHASDSCEECIALAALGWQPIGTTAEPGERICNRFCKCGKLFRNRKSKQERGSWKRRKGDDDRRRRREGESSEDSFDWSDPSVHRAYGGGEPNASGPSLMSPRLIEHLRQYAEPGQKEFGVIIDQETAEILYMREGLKTRVTYQTDVLDDVRQLVVIHTHDEDLAFSAPDWTSFLVNPSVYEDMVVTPNGIYHIRKTEKFDPPHLMGKKDVGDGSETVEAFMLRRENELNEKLKNEPAFKTSQAKEQQIIEMINRELCDKYGVEFLRYTFDD